MNRTEYAKLFGQSEESNFSGEEIAIFKRYIEENNVYTENNFDFFEDNLNYYSVRHTSPHFFSPSRLFHINSNFISSDEMDINLKNYEKSIEWTKETIHPEDSEYVIKQEKYRFLDEINEDVRVLAEHLNNFSLNDYHCLDILIYSDGNIYKYLPSKNFTFTWRKNCSETIDRVMELEFFKNGFKDFKGEISTFIIPIFSPIRECLFLGEFGYRDAIITYGQVLERISQFLNSKADKVKVFRNFDNDAVQKIFNIDGIDRSIMNIIASC